MVVYDILNNFKDITAEWDFEKTFLWIVIDATEIEKLKDVLVISEDNWQECTGNQLSKISFFDGYTFLTLNILDYKDKMVQSKDLNFFLSREYLITIYKENLDVINELIKDIEDSKNCFVLREKPQPSILFYYLIDRIIVKNYDVISALEAQADKIEISILKRPRHEQIDELIHLRRQVYKIRKYLSPLRYIGDSLLSNDNSVIEDVNLKFFYSLNNKIVKLMQALESLVQDLALVREAFESEIANKTNELMKVFTLIATIFLPLNLISGMYGMNVKHIPLNNIDYGYYYVLGIMFTVSLFLIYFFKKKGWL